MKDVFIPIMITLISAVYVLVVGIVFRKRPNVFKSLLEDILSPSSMTRSERFYQAIITGLENNLIEDANDIINLYNDHMGIYRDGDELKYYLVRRLRGFIAYVMRQKPVDSATKEKLAKYKNTVKQWISEMEKKEPYSELPSSERHILIEIDRILPPDHSPAISGRLKDLAGLIRNRQEERDALLKTTRWSVPLTIIGLFLTLLFGGLNIYQFFKAPNQIQNNPNTTTQVVSPHRE